MQDAMYPVGERMSNQDIPMRRRRRARKQRVVDPSDDEDSPLVDGYMPTVDVLRHSASSHTDTRLQITWRYTTLVLLMVAFTGVATLWATLWYYVLRDNPTFGDRFEYAVPLVNMIVSFFFFDYLRSASNSIRGASAEYNSLLISIQTLALDAAAFVRAKDGVSPPDVAQQMAKLTVHLRVLVEVVYTLFGGCEDVERAMRAIRRANPSAAGKLANSRSPFEWALSFLGHITGDVINMRDTEGEPLYTDTEEANILGTLAIIRSKLAAASVGMRVAAPRIINLYQELAIGMYYMFLPIVFMVHMGATMIYVYPIIMLITMGVLVIVNWARIAQRYSDAPLYDHAQWARETLDVVSARLGHFTSIPKEPVVTMEAVRKNTGTFAL